MSEVTTAAASTTTRGGADAACPERSRRVRPASATGCAE